MLEELVANNFFLQNVFTLKPEQFRILLCMALCPAWHGTVSSLKHHLASLEHSFSNPKIAGNAYLGKYGS